MPREVLKEDLVMIPEEKNQTKIAQVNTTQKTNKTVKANQTVAV